jgi:hypothetical protein
MLSIARLFLPASTSWDSLNEVVQSKYGKDDNFSKLVAEATPNLKMVLHLRGALEHQNNKAVVVRDFAVERDGSVAPPTLEQNFRKTVLPQTSVSSLMEELIVALPVYFEMINVHLSSKFAQPVAGMPVFLDLLPADFKQAHFVRVS